MKHNEFETVGELVAFLKTFDQSRPIIYDNDGNSFAVTLESVWVWDETDDKSPIAFFIEQCVL